MSALAWWQSLVSGAAGGAFTLAGQWFTSSHQTKAAREARADERREVRAARRDAFELTQLQELEAAAIRLSKAVLEYRAVSTSLMEIDDSTPEGAEFMAARRELQTLVSRTLDEEVRKELNALAAQSFAAATERRARYAFALVAQVGQVREAIGERIRTLYLSDGS